MFNFQILLGRLYAVGDPGAHQRLLEQKFYSDIHFACGTQRLMHHSGWRQIRQPHGQAAVDIFEREIEMTRNMSVVLYVVVLIAVVVSVDLLFFKNRFWERMMVNIGIVLVFTAFYLRFLKNP